VRTFRRLTPCAFLREVIDGLRAQFGRRLPLEFRMDAAFCQRDIFRLLAARGCAYAIKVGDWSWLPLKQLATARQRWLPVAPNVTGFFHNPDIPQWNLKVRMMLYRKHVAHESPKNFQLDLFTPDDGHFEYAAVATNLPLDLPALYAFICGRGAQEKTIAELKDEFALDVIPTRHYGANTAWQQLSVAHNPTCNFPLIIRRRLATLKRIRGASCVRGVTRGCPPLRAHRVPLCFSTINAFSFRSYLRIRGDKPWIHSTTHPSPRFPSRTVVSSRRIFAKR
jgi:hypothetical protein